MGTALGEPQMEMLWRLHPDRPSASTATARPPGRQPRDRPALPLLKSGKASASLGVGGKDPTMCCANWAPAR